MEKIYKYSLILAGVLLLVAIATITMDMYGLAGIAATLCLVLSSVGFRGNKYTRGFSFTMLIFAAVTASLYFPEFFLSIGDFNTKGLIVPLLQIIMFGMGTSMSFGDFKGVILMPKGVLIGMVCQFTIMPVVGFFLATMFGFPPEIAAGVVLIGASPSGLASNVMTYLAKANLALSVTLTACSTLLAPLMTPMLMKVFAGQFIPIDFWAMMWSIVKIVIIPIIVGLLFNKFFHGKFKWLDKAMPVISMGGIALIITIITASGRDSLITIGLALVMAAIIHNAAGYFLGYWVCRLFKMKEQDCRTIALEVGMQNGGLASGIALEMGKVSTIGLAPAVFGPWMNISGSSLATYWREKSLNEESENEDSNKNE